MVVMVAMVDIVVMVETVVRIVVRIVVSSVYNACSCTGVAGAGSVVSVGVGGAIGAATDIIFTIILTLD